MSDVVDHHHSLSDGQRSLMSQVVQLVRFCLDMPASNAVSECVSALLGASKLT